LQLDKKTKSAIAAYIIGFMPSVKIVGSKSEIDAFSRVLESSRDVYRTLQGNATIEVLSEVLSSKSVDSEHFKKATGLSWPF
jgi:hypothetical protein